MMVISLTPGKITAAIAVTLTLHHDGNEAISPIYF
jgi:hypothetical protein